MQLLPAKCQLPGLRSRLRLLLLTFRLLLIALLLPLAARQASRLGAVAEVPLSLLGVVGQQVVATDLSVDVAILATVSFFCVWTCIAIFALCTLMASGI